MAGTLLMGRVELPRSEGSPHQVHLTRKTLRVAQAVLISTLLKCSAHYGPYSALGLGIVPKINNPFMY